MLTPAKLIFLFLTKCESLGYKKTLSKRKGFILYTSNVIRREQQSQNFYWQQEPDLNQST
jgi:hypothetical protein